MQKMKNFFHDLTMAAKIFINDYGHIFLYGSIHDFDMTSLGFSCEIIFFVVTYMAANSQ